MSDDSAGSFVFAAFGSGADSNVSIALLTAAVIVLTIIYVFFSLCENAAAGSGIKELKQLSKDGNKNAEPALKIKNNPSKYSQSAQAGFCLNLIAAVIISELTYIPPLCSVFSGFIADSGLCFILSAILVFIPVSLVAVIFGKFIPKRLAPENANRILLRYAKPFIFMCTLISPFASLCSCLTNIILKIFGHNTNKSTNKITEEKILMMVDKGEKDGFIEGNTKNMIENVFDFDDTTVGEIMTHRRDVVAVKDCLKISDVTKTAIESGKSRIPVYHEDIDNIVGIIYVKDLLKFVNTNAPTEQIGKDIVHDAVFVPQSKRCSEMFEYMTQHKTQIAIVVDEFGGTGGIITMEDLIESIVGNIQDEYDNEDDEIKRVSESSFSVDGATSLDEITDLTGISFDDKDNDTIAGVMLDRMGHIPKNGEHPSIMINGTRFTVLEVDNLRISKVLVVKSKTNKIKN